MKEMCDQTASELIKLLGTGAITSEKIVANVLARIRQREQMIQAYISLRREEELMEEARACDIRRQNGEYLPPLAGLPIAIKDSIAVKGELLTCGSKILSNFVSPYDATVIERLKAAGTIIVGKTNMDEFGMGSSTENSAMQVTRNPHCLDRVPGGTSGGSAAAVAAGETIIALGSDTGGSIRQPACLCGVVGLKPSYGLVSRYGLVAYASSLEQIGPITRDVEDAALLLDVIAGFDTRDSTSLERGNENYSIGLNNCRDNVIIGLPREFFGEGLDQETRYAIEVAVSALEKEGFIIREVSMPHVKHAIAAYYVIASAEASSNLSRYDGIRFGVRSSNYSTVDELITNSRTEGFGAEVKLRIMIGTYVLSAGYYDAYYMKAQQLRRLVHGDFMTAFKQCDVLIHPISPTPAWKIGEKMSDPVQMYLSDIYTVTANLAGVPGISIPCGQSELGLPLGLQVTGNYLQEKELLKIANRIQQILRSQTHCQNSYK